MDNYKVVVNRNSDDELQHAKYIKREKKNGKWRYYYDEKEIDKAKNKLKIEAHRKAQEVEYAAKDKVLKYKAKKEVEKHKYGKAIQTTVKRGSNHALRTLNKIGKGKLDDHIRKASKKGKKAIDRFFNK